MTGPGMILLWGISSEGPIGAVRDALDRAGRRSFLVDQQIVCDGEIELSVGSTLSGRLWTSSTVIDLADVCASYIRPFDVSRLQRMIDAGRDSEFWRHAGDFHDALLSWTELTPGLVVNRTSAMASNGSKPFQSRLIESRGFCIPDTLITTDPQAATEFWKRHGQVIYKSISSIRSIVRRLTDEHLTRWQDIASCPTQFQQYVCGQEYRVHVVSEEVFACKVHSDADDYRYSPEEAKFEACDLPGDIAERSRAVVREMGLLYAGLDLRRTPGGDWYCFEVNPAPAFTVYECVTKQPIAQAVARLLTSRPQDRP